MQYTLGFNILYPQREPKIIGIVNVLYFVPKMMMLTTLMKLFESFLGELKSYCNIDKIINILEAHYSSEYLNSINASGLPLSELNLKVGPIVILCNLDPANGLCVVGGRMWQWGVG